MEEQKKHGGRREGAGRKPKGTTMISFRIYNDILEKIQAEGRTKTDVINEILRKHYSE